MTGSTAGSLGADDVGEVSPGVSPPDGVGEGVVEVGGEGDGDGVAVGATTTQTGFPRAPTWCSSAPTATTSKHDLPGLRSSQVKEAWSASFTGRPSAGFPWSSTLLTR